MGFHVLIFLGGDGVKNGALLVSVFLADIMYRIWVLTIRLFTNFIRRYLQFWKWF